MKQTGNPSPSKQAQVADAPDAAAAGASARRSGLYTTLGGLLGQVHDDDADGPHASLGLGLPGEELRLDVDGPFPQMVASGTVPVSATDRVSWIANLAATSPDTYSGGIWYRNPAASPFAYTTVTIDLGAGLLPWPKKAKVVFSGGGLPNRERKFFFKSPYFHKVEFEFDSESGVAPITEIGTHDHPIFPPALPNEQLSIQTVFRRAGFDVSVGPGGAPLPVTGPGPGVGGQWSDAEMHDAMSAFWSRFANAPQWALWVLFARQHEWGPGLGGIMFDDIGPNHRQGTALFYESFISDHLPGDPETDAWVARMRFWTAVHEMGHAFNLAHSWQKALGTPWIPLANEPAALSFMNYPHSPSFPDPQAFFAAFEHRFSNGELLFMRHAPASFVQMGNADWFDHHGFQQVALQSSSKLQLELRVNRGTPVYQFLEPVVAELKLKNVSNEPMIIDGNALSTLDRVTIAIKRRGQPARQYIPFARYCARPAAKVLAPGESIYDSAYLSAGLNGVDLAEPGQYVLQAALHLGEQGTAVSRPLTLRIATPSSFDEERLAQDFFSDEVSRVLAFDGTRVLESANDTLREVVAQLPDSKAARHARVALGAVLLKPGRVLALPGHSPELRSAAGSDGKLKVEPAKPTEARKELKAALIKDADVGAETLGHIDYKIYADRLTDALDEEGDRKEAAQVQSQVYDILAARNVTPRVLETIKARRDRYGKEAAVGRRK
jgi:hypothetical protein